MASPSDRVSLWLQPVALNEADAARFLGISARKMAGLRLAGVARKNAIGSYDVEHLIALTRPAALPPDWKNPLDDEPRSASEQKLRPRKTY